MIRRLLVLCVAPVLAACSATAPASVSWNPPRPDLAYVISHGWHTDLALPAVALTGRMAALRAVYPGAKTLIFGFGDRVFAMSRERGPDVWAAALLPARGAILVTAISVTPEAAYGAADVIRVPLPAGGDARLSSYLWRALSTGRPARPHVLGPGPYAGSVVYAAADRYSLIYTCNSWTMDALQTTGLPIGPGAALFAGQVRARIAPFADRPLSFVSTDRAGSSRPGR